MKSHEAFVIYNETLDKFAVSPGNLNFVNGPFAGKLSDAHMFPTIEQAEKAIYYIRNNEIYQCHNLLIEKLSIRTE